MFKHNRLGQMTGDGNGRGDLLIKVILVYIPIRVRSGVVIRVKIAMVILDLNSCGNSLRTEGAFIPSGAS